MSWLQTREGSTLAVITFIASTALLFLDGPGNIKDLAPIGFFFALFGLAYRQITAWTIDRIQHNRQVYLARIEIDLKLEGIEDESLPLEERYDELAICNDRLEPKVDTLNGRNNWRTYYITACVREFLLLSIFALPVWIWALVWNQPLTQLRLENAYNVIWLSIATGLWLMDVDLVLRLRDWIHYH